MIANGVAVALDESQFGGKAVGLGAALRAGLPVPEGMALPELLVAAVAAGDPAAAAGLSRVRDSLPGPLAVRSSCVGEDSAAATFAGQHLTRLNVRSLDQLIEAVAAVWRSGCSESALAYRRKLGLEGAPRMGAVVQRLLDPEVSGVLFTRHPVTGADERVIEATWGLGEAVVQGLVIPDSYRLSPGGEVLERSPGSKPVTIRLRRRRRLQRARGGAPRRRALPRRQPARSPPRPGPCVRGSVPGAERHRVGIHRCRSAPPPAQGHHQRGETGDLTERIDAGAPPR